MEQKSEHARPSSAPKVSYSSLSGGLGKRALFFEAPVPESPGHHFAGKNSTIALPGRVESGRAAATSPPSRANFATAAAPLFAASLFAASLFAASLLTDETELRPPHATPSP